MNNPRAHFFWNFIFSVFFVLVLCAALWWMQDARGGYLSSVPAFDAVMLAFATLRITRLIVYDKIAGWFRALFDRPGGFFETVQDLLQCPWCIGIWAALIVTTVYFIFPWGWSVTFFLGLAGAGSLLQVIANGVGWRAEEYKMDAQEKQRDLRL